LERQAEKYLFGESSLIHTAVDLKTTAHAPQFVALACPAGAADKRRLVLIGLFILERGLTYFFRLLLPLGIAMREKYWQKLSVAWVTTDSLTKLYQPMETCSWLFLLSILTNALISSPWRYPETV
jgi:hypothetical protein